MAASEGGGLLPPPVYDPNAVYYDESGQQVTYEQYVAAYDRQQQALKKAQLSGGAFSKSGTALNTVVESAGEESDLDSSFSPRGKAASLRANDDYETVESLVEELERLKVENMRLSADNDDLRAQVALQTTLKALDLLATVNDKISETNNELQRQYQEALKLQQQRALKAKANGAQASSGPGSGNGSTGKSPRNNGRNPKDIAEISRLKIELETRDKQLAKIRKHLDLTRKENGVLQKKVDEYGTAGQITSLENEIVALKKTIKGYEHELQVMRLIQHQQENALLQRERRHAASTAAHNDKPHGDDVFIPARGPLRLTAQTRKPMQPMGPMKPSQMTALPSIVAAQNARAAAAAAESHIPYVKTGPHGDHVVPEGAGPW